jgi:hypothetical protein
MQRSSAGSLNRGGLVLTRYPPCRVLVEGNVTRSRCGSQRVFARGAALVETYPFHSPSLSRKTQGDSSCRMLRVASSACKRSNNNRKPENSTTTVESQACPCWVRCPSWSRTSCIARSLVPLPVRDKLFIREAKCVPSAEGARRREATPPSQIAATYRVPLRIRYWANLAASAKPLPLECPQVVDRCVIRKGAKGHIAGDPCVPQRVCHLRSAAVRPHECLGRCLLNAPR